MGDKTARITELETRVDTLELETQRLGKRIEQVEQTEPRQKV